MKKINFILFFLVIFTLSTSVVHSESFEEWKIKFSKYALSQGVSESTLYLIIKDLKFLPKVIEYDRYQPEFYEDTSTYISKRANNKKVNIGLKTYKQNFDLINKVEKKFNVEKELLLSLMGIETNFGKYLGKMDILSSLATLSYDKRRSEFFTKELIIALKLIDNNKIRANELYGSWAGAFGNFQFMPSTILNNAIDFNNDNLIDLKSNEDSFASAANYLSRMGWNTNDKCFNKIILDDQIPTKYLKGFTCNDSYAFDLAMVNYLYRISKKINNLEFFDPISVIVKNRKYGKSSWSKSPLKFFP